MWIERIDYMAKSGVLSLRITTSMHNTTHIDAPAHVVGDTPFIDEVPAAAFFWHRDRRLDPEKDVAANPRSCRRPR
jgi:kynurenine formamidase